MTTAAPDLQAELLKHQQRLHRVLLGATAPPAAAKVKRTPRPKLSRLESILRWPGDIDTPYRKARVVARVLVSQRLKQQPKWCQLARQLAADPSVEERLIAKAITWFEAQGQLRLLAAKP